MCGIVGYIGPRGSTEILLTGLSKLEYRGYDSAGIAVLTDQGLKTKRAEGKLRNLVGVVQNDPIDGQVGIGHTRWATHGRPSETNAHPHRKGSIAVVHNDHEAAIALAQSIDADYLKHAATVRIANLYKSENPEKARALVAQLPPRTANAVFPGIVELPVATEALNE